MGQETTLPRYIPELDGLRAVAILLVMLFHLSIPGFSLGWSGVNLFFVISGFLITGILLDSKGHSLYFKNFYIRRVLRIFPIYYLTLFTVTIAGVLSSQNVRHLWYYLLYLQNYILGYTNFSPDFPFYLNHTWSLAIEEQFYLLWPYVVHRLNRRSLALLCMSLFTISFLFRGAIFLIHHHYLFFTPLPAHMDSLATGAILALTVRSGMAQESILRITSWSLLISGITILVGVLLTGQSHYWRPPLWTSYALNVGLFNIMAVFFAALIATVILSDSLFSRLLVTPFVRHIGKISYGLYMYHLPVFLLVPVFLNQLYLKNVEPLPTVVELIVKVVITFFIAELSWIYFEQRFNAIKQRFQ